MLLLFDDVNINVFIQLKKKARMLAKNVDESETWMQDMNNKQKTLNETI